METKRLYAAILWQAVVDYVNDKDKQEIEEFLLSDWGKFVCTKLGRSASDILAELPNVTKQQVEEVAKLRGYDL